MSETDLTTIPNIGPTKAAALKAAGFETTDEVEAADVDELCEADGIGRRTAEDILGISSLDRGGKEAKFEDVREDLLDVATEPVTDEIVANAAGISRATLHNYLDRHPEFEREYRQARAQNARDITGLMLDDEWDGEDRNLRFIAERAHGFVKTEKREVEGSMEHTGEGGGPMEVTVRRERYDPDE